MKHAIRLFILFLFFYANYATAQVKVGDNAKSIHPSAAFEVESKTKGMLIPRMTNAERIAISNADTGLIVYQTTDTTGFYYYDGSQWVNIKGGNTTLPDADGDGVIDQFDQEPNTPSGAPVDSHGVAKDTDGDGVPDYKDKELLTLQSCFPVDADGIGACPVETPAWESTDNNGIMNTNNGNIGINTVHPVSKFSNTDTAITGSDRQKSSSTALTWRGSGNGYIASFYNDKYGPGTNGVAVKITGASNTAFDVSYGTKAGDMPTPLFTVKGTGRIGINTSSPAAALDVNGDVRYSGSLNLNVQYITSTVMLTAGVYTLSSATCPVGTRLIGGVGGIFDQNTKYGEVTILYSGPDTQTANVWDIRTYNTTENTKPLVIYAICQQ